MGVIWIYILPDIDIYGIHLEVANPRCPVIFRCESMSAQGLTGSHRDAVGVLQDVLVRKFVKDEIKVRFQNIEKGSDMARLA